MAPEMPPFGIKRPVDTITKAIAPADMARRATDSAEDEPATLSLDSRDTSSRHVVLPAVPAPAAPRSHRKHDKSAASEFKAIED